MTTFEKMDEEIEKLKKNIGFVHTALLKVLRGFEQKSAVFALFVAACALALLIVSALLFDWLVTLNAVLTRINLWVVLGVLILSLTRIFSLFILSTARLAEAERRKYREILRRLATLQGYETGHIDEEGIRRLYAETAEKMRLMRSDSSDISTLFDWILYCALMLSVVLFGLIFV